ncbi:MULTISPECIES: hypothetical protein [unclassified Vibrio]|uniref:hypothetical protein n=1 Tax=unclassified Vibrio TaxID=2614977 RepID=UPI0014839329|nr:MULTISPECIES: hypothetical protein [unclassified Vibrio]NNN46265.1 hypothetical protein [Vibrio sp. 1-1(7)]NNN74143.1 hypothetical protein [Vibrio sp. 12-2(3-a)]
MEYLKQLFTILLTLVLGSFFFVGILEDFKSDDSIKVKQLEDYFKPARIMANACLKQQNNLYLHYPQNGTSLRLFYNAMFNLMENPQLESNNSYEVVLKGILHNMQVTQKTQSELPKAVAACREEVFLSLEALSIATGTFEYFSEQSKERSQKLNEVARLYEKKINEILSGFDAKELEKMMYQFGSLDLNSDNEIKALMVKFSEKLPIIESVNFVHSEREQEIYRIEADFFSKIREKSATQIDAGFKQGFFSWLIN